MALSNQKILITGATGQVAAPIAHHLARNNEVWCLARFTAAGSREALEAHGIKTVRCDFGTGEFGDLPRDFTHVIHSGVDVFGDLEGALRVNAEGTGLLMTHCRQAQTFLHVSSCVVYRDHPDPTHAYKETDALGGYALYAPTYGVSKLCAEAVVRMAARQLGLRSIIARLNVAYGTAGHGGVPVQHFGTMLKGKAIPILRGGRPNYCSPIHEDDLACQAEAFLQKATVPATIVNWGGDEAVTDVEFCRYLAALAGIEVRFEESDHAFNSYITDNTRRRELVGDCRVQWRDGMRRAIAARFPQVQLRTA
jgi:nucleoside-diphosphate-sugar epimerase